MKRYVDIVFDAAPGATTGRFIEVEDMEGRSVSIGEWIEQADGHWALRIPDPRPVVEDDGLQLSIATTESVDMGDHGERMTKAHEYVPGETVEALVRRVFPALSNEWRQHNPTDKITIKVIVGADGETTGDVRHVSGPGDPF